MDLPTEATTIRKVVPKTPQVKASQVFDKENHAPPTPFKPKIKETKLALNDETSDFTIICEGQHFITHKSILEASSPYFARMFRFNGSENNDKEVHIPDVDTVTMKHILDYMYTSTYQFPGGETVHPTAYCNHSTYALLHGPPTAPQIFKRKCPCAGKMLSASHLLKHVRIYTVADYFDMHDLKAFARQGVIDVLHVYWQYEGLDLADALEEAFTSTLDDDKGIRDVLVDAMKMHPGLVVDEGDVEEWLEDHPEVKARVNWD
ncbi:uncharacterized protein J4E78_005871 [Alternaria triticimaculans]|uniref:uncharacterized protein n=1 Tax=Alternaria triticimaculans TaxID=297637 RepID=UPI0020C3A880|nr:uncharacterized protein J4E78_005871 [Alternaria triticimaculans]KAI4659443.1 hypothetical protein J4E78_005871 [Alternaria triticimaculans]